jgi:hypothetical protein
MIWLILFENTLNINILPIITRLEASKTANVVVAKIDTKKFEKNRTPQYFQPVRIQTISLGKCN